MLVLFDIDGTLLLSEGVGMGSIEAAGRRLHGPAFRASDVKPGGGIDPVLLREVLARNGVEPTRQAIQDLRRAYEAELAEALSVRNTVQALPGAAELVARVAQAGDMTTGLLTGNYEATGSLKLTHGGFAVETFEIRVWGDDSPECPFEGDPRREHLPEVARDRYHARFERSLRDRDVVIIGDTERDIEAARAVGARVIAVSTGHVPAGTLESFGPDRVIESLEDTASILAWIREEAA
ncbi:MAG: HAD hydrolase-like protein [Planctomycetota bacterium]